MATFYLIPVILSEEMERKSDVVNAILLNTGLLMAWLILVAGCSGNPVGLTYTNPIINNTKHKLTIMNI